MSEELEVKSTGRNRLYIVNNEDLALQTNIAKAVIKITHGGHIFLNDIPVEKMNVPEIREVMVQILEEMRAQSMIPQMSRQTDYLLQELEKCKKAQTAVAEVVK